MGSDHEAASDDNPLKLSDNDHPENEFMVENVNAENVEI